MKLPIKAFVVVLALIAIVSVTALVKAATTPSLGIAASFGILSSTYTNTTGGTTINGDLGYTTGPATAPTVNGSIYIADSTYTQAGTDQGTALTNLNAQPCTVIGAIVTLDSYDLDGVGPLLPGTFTPGCYSSTGAMNVTAGTTVTLSGAGTYIFRPDGALTTGASSVVSLANGATACDVFWTPTGATTLGANSTFVGTDIDNAGITIGDSVTWTGRALAFGGTVTTDSDTINRPSCSTSSSATSNSGGSSGNTGASTSEQSPLINVTKIANPSALPDGPGLVTYTYLVTNTGDLPLSKVVLTDNKCARVTFMSGDRNRNSELELDEIWTYRCTQVLAKSTTNVATVTGYSEGKTVRDTALARVTVGAESLTVSGYSEGKTVRDTVSPLTPPKLPNAGIYSDTPSNIWSITNSLRTLFSLIWVN